MSLGGKAALVAQQIPHSVLCLPQGLSILLRRLDSDLGSELQDRIKDSARAFMRYKRPRGVGAADHIVMFEKLYAEANSHGLYYSAVTLTMLLLESAMLSDSQEQWIMQTVAGDYSRYHEVRRALRRLPGLDSRHGQDARLWTVTDSNTEREHKTYNNNSESWQGQQDYTNTGETEHNELYPTWDEDGSTDTETDDFCSTASDVSEPTYMLLKQSYAVYRRKRHFDKKGGKGKPHRRRKRKGKGKGYHPVDNKRNHSDEVPQGWTREKWMARVPCEGCGSRWHRDCRNKKGGKGKKGGGKKGQSFSVFMMQAALLASTAATMPGAQANMSMSTCEPDAIVHHTTMYEPCSFTTHSPVFEQMFDLHSVPVDAGGNPYLEEWMQPECFYDCFEEMLECPFHDCVENSNTAHSMFAISDSQHQVNSHPDMFVGVEAFSDRETRYNVFNASSRLRFGLLVDTGAPNNVVGEEWLQRISDTHKLHDRTSWAPHHAELSGVGRGSVQSKWRAQIPIALKNSHEASWDAQVVGGAGKYLPPLHGLDSMIRHQTILDFTNPKELSMTCLVAPGKREKFKLEKINGHLILPCDHYEHAVDKPAIPSKDTFIKDPLGLSTWMFDAESHENTYNHETHETFDETYYNNLQPWTWPTNLNYNATATQNNHNTQHNNACHESSELLEPDDSLQEVTLTSVPACPAWNISDTTEQTQTPSNQPTYTITHMLQFKPKQTTTTANTTMIIKTTPSNTIIDVLPAKRKMDWKRPAEKFEHFPFADNQTQQQQALAATLKTIKKTSKAMKRVMQNKTYQKKYQGLPKGTPIPEYEEQEGTWDFWEFWAGSAKLTRTAKRYGLRTGPPISHEWGWCLSLETHRQEIQRLFWKHKPRIIWGAPLCSPWSQSCTTLDPTVKQTVRKEQLDIFLFFEQLCNEQHKTNRAYGLEQPRTSELLRTPPAERLSETAVDSNLCMCMHDLEDPISHVPYMKPTTIRGTKGLITNRTAKMCDRYHKGKGPKHEEMQGNLPGGQSRTHYAQEYTKSFCTSVIRDCKDYLSTKHNKTYPVNRRDIVEDHIEDDEVAVEDPYGDPPDETELDAQKIAEEARLRREAQEIRKPVPKRTWIEPKAKRLAAPPEIPRRDSSEPAQEHQQQGTASSSSVTQGQSTASSSRDKPKPDTTQQAAPDEQVIQEQPPEPLPLAEARPMLEEDTRALDALKTQAMQRLSAGAAITIQVGPRMKILQELFGTPHGKSIRLAILTRSPPAIAPPEPILSRANAEYQLVATLATADAKNWSVKPWRTPVFDTRYTKKPALELVLYGNAQSDTDLAEHLEATTLETLEERQETDMKALDSLPTVLRILNEGSDAEKVKTLTALHKRLHHRKADELRTILRKSGLPVRVLALCEEAVDNCTTCRRWAKQHTKPAVKVNLSKEFNQLVYADIMFIGEPATRMFLVLVDDCIRMCAIRNIDFRDFASLEKGLRQAWITRYGPMIVLRSDKEGTLAADQFGIYLEKLGVKRELVVGGEHHGFLGPLDRKIQIIRAHAPLLLDQLGEDRIVIDDDDLAAELELTINTQLTYNGIAPYTCLYGKLPRELWSEEMEQISGYSDTEPFYEHAHVRMRAIQTFHQALLQHRMERALASRPRKGDVRTYSPGDIVDVWRNPKQKSLAGWRGPATVLAQVGEGMLTVRWQSSLFDVPIHHVRPHLPAVSRKPMPTAPVPPAVEDKKEEEKFGIREWLQQDAQENQEGDAMDIQLVLNEAFEDWTGLECADQYMLFSCKFLETLVSLTASIPSGELQNHTFSKKQFSRDAVRDLHAVFMVGRKAADQKGIKNYQGVILASGRRHIPNLPGIARVHVLYWLDNPDAYLERIFKGNQVVDFHKLIKIEEVNRLHWIAILESDTESAPVLEELLNHPVEPEATSSFQPEGRVRFQFEDEMRTSPFEERNEMPKSKELDEHQSEDIVSSLEFRSTSRIDADDEWSPRDDNISQSEAFSMLLNASYHSINPTRTMYHNARGTKPNYERLFPVHMTEGHHPATSSTSKPSNHPQSDGWYFFDGEVWCTIDESELDPNEIYPVDRATRPATKEELKGRKVEFTAARKKELESWLENKTGRAEKRVVWEKQSGRKPIPCRWVDTWKLKNGQLIAKSRLCLKGFAEPVSADEVKASPTANRVSHRIVKHTAVQRRWPLASLDVSTAFLKGWTFAELEQKGMTRKPVAFVPCEQVWELLAEINPAEFSKVLDNPGEWIFVLEKAAYGLRDAPLLWHLRAVEVLKDLGYKAMLHDACTFILRDSASKKLSAVLTLHVDDLLMTSAIAEIQKLQDSLSKVFGSLSLDLATKGFKHFGVDVWQSEKSDTVIASQLNYVNDLRTIEMPAKCNKTLPCTSEYVTQFRALVSAVAWVGVTYPWALSSASLLQGCLPQPTWNDLHKLNSNVLQLQAHYKPLQYRYIEPPLLLANVGDSSFANTGGKYSQGGYFTLLCSAKVPPVVGSFIALDFRSNKSKRVATSTMHAEALAKIAGIEAATYIQTYMLELEQPLTSLQLLNPEPEQLNKIVSLSDCNDLHDALTGPTQPTCTNKHLSLYIAALREYRSCGRVQAFIWIDTRDQLANGLTKLNENGEANLDEVGSTWDTFVYKLKHTYRWHDIWSTE